MTYMDATRLSDPAGCTHNTARENITRRTAFGCESFFALPKAEIPPLHCHRLQILLEVRKTMYRGICQVLIHPVAVFMGRKLSI